jgi:hypothetical protein
VGSEVVENDGPSNTTAPRLTGAEAIKAHVTLGVGLALCVVAFWIEIKRALEGNGLSWAYVFEWPLLGVFALYMWWKVIHPEGDQAERSKKKAIAPEFDGMLAAWQEHQDELTRQHNLPDSGERS